MSFEWKLHALSYKTNLVVIGRVWEPNTHVKINELLNCPRLFYQKKEFHYSSRWVTNSADCVYLFLHYHRRHEGNAVSSEHTARYEIEGRKGCHRYGCLRLLLIRSDESGTNSEIFNSGSTFRSVFCWNGLKNKIFINRFEVSMSKLTNLRENTSKIC